MTYVIRTTLIFGIVAAVTALASSGAVYAQGSFLDRVNSKTVEQLRADVRSRFPRQTTQNAQNTQNNDGVKIKLDRAGLRRYIDRYLPRN